MKFNLPTRDKCKAIVNRTDSFYCAERVVEGQKVELYDYRLASISDFVDNNAFELRGLCFVEQSDGTWERNLLLNKFFNYSQTIGWMPEDLDNKNIVRVQDKCDGSIIGFVQFQNGKIRAKSKMSFISEQAVMAQKIFDKEIYNKRTDTNCDSNIKQFVKDCFTANLIPVFELVSPENQIVLEYQNTELVLLQIRRNNGIYLTTEEMNRLSNHYNITCTKDYNLSKLENEANLLGEKGILGTLLWHKKHNNDDIEGWVVTFDDGQMAKIKTDHYISLHGLIGPDTFRENLLVETIIEGNIDDVIAALVEGEKKNNIIAMEEKVTKEFNRLVLEFIALRMDYFYTYEESRKDFALALRDKPMFVRKLLKMLLKNIFLELVTL